MARYFEELLEKFMSVPCLVKSHGLGLLALALILGLPGIAGAADSASRLPKPTPEQVAWQDLEVGLFIHFDIPVFARPEYDWRKDEVLDPKLYFPTNLNTDQWMEAAKGIGARYAVFVAIRKLAVYFVGGNVK